MKKFLSLGYITQKKDVIGLLDKSVDEIINNVNYHSLLLDRLFDEEDFKGFNLEYSSDGNFMVFKDTINSEEENYISIFKVVS
jgi:hypothetical protein